MTALSCEVRKSADAARLILRGELDMASVAAAQEELEDLLGAGLNEVILDIRELDFMDSTGVKFLLDAREGALQLGVKIALAYEEGMVERVLTVSGVTSLFDRPADDRP